MSYRPATIHLLAKDIGDKLQKHQLKLVTAESCTGGQLAQTITGTPGASAWFERGFIAYSDLSKQQMLGVKQTLLNQYGAVSGETAIAMATGAFKNSAAQISIAITGIAGPNGGTEKNPVGTVWTAWVSKDFSETQCQHHSGDRLIIRYNAVEFALQTLLNLLS